MNATKRNFVLGLIGIALLLISMLVYAQVGAARNYDLTGVQQAE